MTAPFKSHVICAKFQRVSACLWCFVLVGIPHPMFFFFLYKLQGIGIKNSLQFSPPICSTAIFHHGLFPALKVTPRSFPLKVFFLTSFHFQSYIAYMPSSAAFKLDSFLKNFLTIISFFSYQSLSPLFSPNFFFCHESQVTRIV